MTRKLKYFNTLDGLRGIAAFSVFIFHFFYDKRVTGGIIEIERIKSLVEIMQHGVTLFFVLSGFVITRILLNTKTQVNYFSRFYKNRILRIFPLYYLYLIIHYYIFPAIIFGSPNLEFSKQLPMYFYLQNMGWLTGLKVIGPGHYWSLAVEEHFYLIWPLVVLYFSKKNLHKFTLFLIIFSIPLKILFLLNNIDINHNTFSRYDSIMIGCFIALIEYRKDYHLPPIGFIKFFGLSLSLIVIGGLVYIYQEHTFLIKSMLKHLILGLFFGLIIYYLITSIENSWFNRFLTTDYMQYLGKISYGIYVWHMMAFTIVSLFEINVWFVNLALSILITISLAHTSYFWFERHFLKLKLKT